MERCCWEEKMHIAKIMLAMLNETKMPYYFWVETIVLIVYIMNKTPTFNNSWHDAKGKAHRQKNWLSHISKCFVALHMWMSLMERVPKSIQKLQIAFSMDIFWNNRGLPSISCKWVKMFLMRWIINIHQWNNKKWRG
jgi:hypothetical protein